jgi:excisionase family DNA binding protein
VTTPNPRVVEALAAALLDHLAQPDAVGKLAGALAEHLPASASPAINGALLDAKQAAALLGVPKSWVLAEARAGRLPHARLGHYVRFERDELLAWVSSRAQGPRRRAQENVTPPGGRRHERGDVD